MGHVVAQGLSLWGLTFELSGRQRQDARARAGEMYRVSQAGPWWPAVGAPLERGVRRHLCSCMNVNIHDFEMMSMISPPTTTTIVMHVTATKSQKAKYPTATSSGSPVKRMMTFSHHKPDHAATT